MNINENEKIYIEMSELSKMINTKDARTALKWCEEMKLPIIPVGKKRMTYRFLAEAEIDKRILQILKKQHPNKWQELFQYYKNNNICEYLLATQNEVTTSIKLEKRASPKSRFAKDFAKE
jgi:hypothetical protein